MDVENLQANPEFRNWLERLIEDKVREELERERTRHFAESFAIISVRDQDPLAESIARILGKPLVRRRHVLFGDGEKKVLIEENLRGRNVFVVATVGEREDPDVSFANAARVISTLRRTCKVSQINLVAPCLWYQAQDKTHARREPISVRDVADDLIRRGMNHIIVVELHAEQIEIAFDSFDHLKMAPIFADFLSRRFAGAGGSLVLIAPDEGGVRMREELHKNLETSLVHGLAGVHQLRELASVDKKEMLKGFVGDVRGKIAVVYDDMVRSGSTMFQAAGEAKANGAARVVGIAAHFFGFDHPTRGRFDAQLDGGGLDELIVSNTRPGTLARVASDPVLQRKVTVIDIAPYIARAIRNYQTGGTVKDMIASVPDRQELYRIAHRARDAG